jgi:hypothetical protein
VYVFVLLSHRTDIESDISMSSKRASGTKMSRSKSKAKYDSDGGVILSGFEDDSPVGVKKAVDRYNFIFFIVWSSLVEFFLSLESKQVNEIMDLKGKNVARSVCLCLFICLARFISSTVMSRVIWRSRIWPLMLMLAGTVSQRTRPGLFDFLKCECTLFDLNFLSVPKCRRGDGSFQSSAMDNMVFLDDVTTRFVRGCS